MGNVTNVGWKDDSTATVTWDFVEGANYYEIEVYVYDEDLLLGFTTTGTTDTVIDVQQEIMEVYNNQNSSKEIVFAECRVRAIYLEGGEILSFGDWSEIEQKIPYAVVTKVKMPTPQNASISEDSRSLVPKPL